MAPGGRLLLKIMMKVKIVGCTVLLGLLLACNTEEEGVIPGHNGAALRIENVSALTISEISVSPGGGGTQLYENLEPGAVSGYKAFDFVYRYAYLRAVVEGDTLTLQPFDYVGEQQFDSGAYTYLIDFEGEPGSRYVSIAFRED